jgi:hypothetical protein
MWRLAVHCCDSHLHCARRPLGSGTQLGLSHPHAQSRPTLRTAGSLQGVPPSCCGRRATVWSGVCSNGPSGFREAARRASSLRTWRWRVRMSPCPSCPTTHPPYVPRPSAVDHLDENMLNPTSDLLSHCHRRVCCPVCTSGSLRAERGGCEWRRSELVSAATTVSLKECHGQGAV